MKRFLAIGLIVLSIASAVPALAQTPSITAMTEADRTRFAGLRASGFEALFNLDYEKARQSFREIARLYPDHPAGPQFLAASLWIETLYETRRLQASLYSSDSFYAPNEDKADPKVIEQFRAWTREARKLAEARLKANPKDGHALGHLVEAYAVKKDAAGADEALNRLREADPSNKRLTALQNMVADLKAGKPVTIPKEQ